MLRGKGNYMMATLIATALLVLASAPCAGREFHVAPSGADTNPGTSARPFASLERARDAVRSLKLSDGLPGGGVTVWVRGGVYPITRTLELGEQDSGAQGSPVVYRAAARKEVRLTGGREVTGFVPVRDPEALARIDESARGRVLCADLRAQGIADFGEVTPRGFGRKVTPAGLELFFNDRPMTLARWPNDDWATIAAVPAGPQGGRFTYEGDRPERWAKADDIWLHGYWTWAWADSYEKAASIDTEAKEISTHSPHGVYGYSANKRYRALNLLEELDQPGEWYLDRKAGVLYFWPPEPMRGGRAVVSIMAEPLVKLSGASNVILRGFTMEVCRGTAVEISGGSRNLVAGCTLRNIGNLAVAIDGGAANGVTGCDIRETGDGGILLSGGDRKTLTPAGNFVENCCIRSFSRWCRTYRPAVLVQGVGNRTAHNLICDAPHSAIIQGGNDHVVEFNDICRVCDETGDAGAFYMGRDWTQRGNVVRFNYFHDLGMFRDKFSAHNFTDTMAVYLDDWTSGTRVIGNIFYRANRAAMIGGGRDNTVENNVFIDCDPSLHVDARGLADWTKSYFDGSNNTLFDRLKAMSHDQPPYSVRYPELVRLLDDEPRAPKGNRIARNVCTGGKWLDLHGVDAKLLDLADNLVDQDPLFVDREKCDFRLRGDSPAWKLGFKPIPVERIGPYLDEYRTKLPDGWR